LDIPEDIFGHQICLRKECWKLQRKKKRSQNRYAKIGYFVNKQLTLVVERCLFTITTTTKCFAFCSLSAIKFPNYKKAQKNSLPFLKHA